MPTPSSSTVKTPKTEELPLKKRYRLVHNYAPINRSLRDNCFISGDIEAKASKLSGKQFIFKGDGCAGFFIVSNSPLATLLSVTFIEDLGFHGYTIMPFGFKTFVLISNGFEPSWIAPSTPVSPSPSTNVVFSSVESLFGSTLRHVKTTHAREPATVEAIREQRAFIEVAGSTPFQPSNSIKTTDCPKASPIAPPKFLNLDNWSFRVKHSSSQLVPLEQSYHHAGLGPVVKSKTKRKNSIIRNFQTHREERVHQDRLKKYHPSQAVNTANLVAGSINLTKDLVIDFAQPDGYLLEVIFYGIRLQLQGALSLNFSATTLIVSLAPGQSHHIALYLILNADNRIALFTIG
ncbi:hypothetical protein BCV70DRAFT_219259 [Testicularia cyperi]|uniref:Uncharacterized protein n=1 Tax=Testicularia cyperi TaxID=1882483 RepID=A0A317XI08_9BASI|nr:hypothetical protein BCV70DRAFT_219259 [Testicularia cyperi]